MRVSRKGNFAARCRGAATTPVGCVMAAREEENTLSLFCFCCLFSLFLHHANERQRKKRTNPPTNLHGWISIITQQEEAHTTRQPSILPGLKAWSDRQPTHQTSFSAVTVETTHQASSPHNPHTDILSKKALATCLLRGHLGEDAERSQRNCLPRPPIERYRTVRPLQWRRSTHAKRGASGSRQGGNQL